MRLLALPLRILLAVALVLNGIGGAAGAVADLALGADSATHAAADPNGDGGHADAGDANLAGPAVSGHPCPSSGEEACDEDPRCLQACTHTFVAVAQRVVIGAQANGAGRPLHPISVGYASPPARSPIRPPIN